MSLSMISCSVLVLVYLTKIKIFISLKVVKIVINKNSQCSAITRGHIIQ